MCKTWQKTGSQLLICTIFRGILPKGPYLPCISMAGRALLAGCTRFEVIGNSSVEWISNHVHHKTWNEIAYTFKNFNGAIVKVWEWIKKFHPTIDWACDHLPMLRWKLIHVSKEISDVNLDNEGHNILAHMENMPRYILHSTICRVCEINGTLDTELLWSCCCGLTFEVPVKDGNWSSLYPQMSYHKSVPDHQHTQRRIQRYRQVSNIRRTLVGNKIDDHSDVVWASPVGAAPTASSFST